MDSLTQIALGAAVAEAGADRRAGRKAALVGALFGTLPDLDVFVSLGDPVSDFTYHRSATHSVVVLTLLTPVAAWLVRWLVGPQAGSYRRWCVVLWLVLMTHIALDSLTIYGTQLLWPLSEHPFGLGSVFIIDPLYTVPLALGLLAAVVYARRPIGRRLNAVGLALSTAYLALGIAAQSHVTRFAEASLARQNVAYERLAVLAAPFNLISWRVLVRQADGYAVAWHSVVAPAPDLRLRFFPSADDLLAPIEQTWSVARLAWFSKGFYAVETSNDELRLSDLRMGVEPDRFAFTFVVGRRASGGVVATEVTRVPPVRWRDGDLARLWDVVLGAPSLTATPG